MATALEQIQQRRQQIEQQLSRLPSPTSQTYLRGLKDRNMQPGSALQQLQQRKNIETQRTQLKTQVEQLREYEQQLQPTDYSNVIQQKIQSAEQQRASKSDIKYAKATARLQLLQQVRRLSPEQQQALVESGQLEKLEKKAEGSGKAFFLSAKKGSVDIKQVEESLQMSLTPEARSQIESSFVSRQQSLTPQSIQQALQRGQTQAYLEPVYINPEREISNIQKQYQASGLTGTEARILAEKSYQQQQSLIRPTGIQRGLLLAQVPETKIQEYKEKAISYYEKQPYGMDVKISKNYLKPVSLEFADPRIQERTLDLITPEPVQAIRKINATVPQANQSTMILFREYPYKKISVPRILGETTDVGSFFVPIIGQTRMATSTGKIVGEFSTSPSKIQYVKEKPLESLFGGLVVFAATKKISPLKIRSFELGDSRIILSGIESPKGRAVTFGSMIIEPSKFTYPKALFLDKLPKKDIRLNVGTPSLEKELLKISEGTEIKVSTALETKAFKKTLSNLKKEQVVDLKRVTEGLPTQQSILRKTKGVKSKFITEFPKTTERLPDVGVKELLKLGKEEQGVLFGSFSRAGQLAKEYKIGEEMFVLNKVPRDIEFRFDLAGQKELQRITESGVKRLKDVGIKAREIKDTPFAIEARQPSGIFEKVAEFKGKENVLEGESVPEYVLGIQKVGKPFKLKGIITTKLEEELRGVTQGVARIRKTDGLIDVIPSPKRMKDIGSVVVSARTLQMSKKIFKNSLLKDIEKFESLYPKALVMEQLKSPNLKVLLADFSQTGTSFKSLTLGSGTKILTPEISKLDKKQYDSYEEYYKNIERNAEYNYSKSISTSPKVRSPSFSISVSDSISKSISPKIKSPSPSISPYKISSPSLSVSRIISRSFSTSKSPSPSYSPYPYKIPTYKTPPVKSPSFTPAQQSRSMASISRNYSKAYKLLVKRYGKYKPIGEFTRGRALQTGERITRETLGATFKLEPTSKLLSQQDISYKVSPLFRTYKIKKGKRVPLLDEFIQKRGTRLSSRGELLEIKRARRKR